MNIYLFSFLATGSAALLICIISYFLFKWGIVTKVVILVCIVALTIANMMSFVIRSSMSHLPRIGIAVVASLILLGVMIPYIRHFLIGPTKKLESALTMLAEGDLTYKLALESNDEFGRMSNTYNIVVENLLQLIGSIKQQSARNTELAGSLTSAAQEVSGASDQVASTVTEIAKSAQELSRHASTVARSSEQASTTATGGAQAAQSVKGAMTGITETTTMSSSKIESLSADSQKIGTIAETINGISEQTNLLALNAAIEAARAGDAGRGFAVVADEVRKLAEESQKATSQISGLIGTIRDRISDSVQSIGGTTNRVGEGVTAVDNALISFQQIPALVDELRKSIADISAIAEENAAGAEEVSASVEEVASTMQQITGSAEELSRQAKDLEGLVEKFKT